MREVFDNISMQVISFLENHIGVASVEFLERAGCADMTIQKWEEENAPIKLPDDFKAFLQITDGLQLCWKIKKNDLVIELGSMHLNKLREIQRIQGESFKFATLGEYTEDSSDEDEVDE